MTGHSNPSLPNVMGNKESTQEKLINKEEENIICRVFSSVAIDHLTLLMVLPDHAPGW